MVKGRIKSGPYWPDVINVTIASKYKIVSTSYLFHPIRFGYFVTLIARVLAEAKLVVSGRPEPLFAPNVSSTSCTTSLPSLTRRPSSPVSDDDVCMTVCISYLLVFKNEINHLFRLFQLDHDGCHGQPRERDHHGPRRGRQEVC
jgi:hypothetical protein